MFDPLINNVETEIVLASLFVKGGGFKVSSLIVPALFSIINLTGFVS